MKTKNKTKTRDKANKTDHQREIERVRAEEGWFNIVLRNLDHHLSAKTSNQLCLSSSDTMVTAV